MKIFMMYRLMNGMEPVLAKRSWQPGGIPTAARLIEALDQSDHDLDLVLYPPEPRKHPNALKASSGPISIDGLKTKITVMSYGPLVYLPARLALLLAPLYRAIWALIHCWAKAPDLFYTDRGNVIASAIIARLSKAKTVLRVLGAPPSLWEILRRKRHPILRLSRWAFKSKFDVVIATRDGSRIRKFLDQAIYKDIPCHIALNGHLNLLDSTTDNEPPKSAASTPKKVSIVSLSRLDHGKGIDDLIATIASLPDDLKAQCHLTIVGSGPIEQQLKDLAAEKNCAEIVTFTGRIANKDVPTELSKHDIFVSTNEIGQINNSNIEAASKGLALMLVKTTDGDDPDAKKIFGEDSVNWISRQDMQSDFRDKLSDLIRDRNQIITLQQSSKAIAQKFPSWDERISWEISLLESLLDTNS